VCSCLLCVCQQPVLVSPGARLAPGERRAHVYQRKLTDPSRGTIVVEVRGKRGGAGRGSCGRSAPQPLPPSTQQSIHLMLPCSLLLHLLLMNV
jgi:hypothetical protein